MKKRIISSLLTLAMVLSFTAFAPSVAGTAAKATADAAYYSASTLYTLGLFKGTGTDASGAPTFELDRAPTRAEAVAMLIRLLGREKEALNTKVDSSFLFTDVPEWAKPYVNLAFKLGYTSGYDSYTFGSDDYASASQYITFVLRALGYKSGTDFYYDSAWTLSDSLGMTGGEYYAGCSFTRGDAAKISCNALVQSVSGKNFRLLPYLYGAGAVSDAAIKSTGLNWAMKRSEVGYPEHIYVPDFGAYFGISILNRKSDNDTITFLYSLADVQAADPDGSLLAGYQDLLTRWSCTKGQAYYKTDGSQIMQYTTRAGDQIEMEQTWVDGVSSYKIVIKFFGRYSYPKKVKGYPESSEVPDLGVYFGTSASGYSMSTGSVNSFGYYYKYTDVYVKDKNAIGAYIMALSMSGFTYSNIAYAGNTTYYYYTKGSIKVAVTLKPGEYLYVNVTM